MSGQSDNKTFSAGDWCCWRGQQCRVISREQILTSGGDQVWCLAIQVAHLPAYKGLRFVRQSACSKSDVTVSGGG